MKIDITTGDVIIPREIDYSFKLMFEDREIMIKAYNLNTILAEKIESILVRNVSNTRARDFYDIYILFTLNKANFDRLELKEAIWKKAEERKSTIYIENYEKYLNDVFESKDMLSIWDSYKEKYDYVKDIKFESIIKILKDLMKVKGYN